MINKDFVFNEQQTTEIISLKKAQDIKIDAKETMELEME